MRKARHLPYLYILFLSFSPTCAVLDRIANTVPINKATPQKIISPEKPPFWSLTIAPAIGLPINTPKAENEYNAPFLTPSCRTSDKVATIAGIMESVHPEANPYNAAYTINGALDDAGSHSPRVITPANTVFIIITLKTPNLSPM